MMWGHRGRQQPLRILKGGAPAVTFLPQVFLAALAAADDGAQFVHQDIGCGVCWCVSRHRRGVVLGAWRRREDAMQFDWLDVPRSRLVFCARNLPRPYGAPHVDLSKPQATAASARVYGMVVRLAAMWEVRHGALPSLTGG
jgi:hypothetical protein